MADLEGLVLGACARDTHTSGRVKRLERATLVGFLGLDGRHGDTLATITLLTSTLVAVVFLCFGNVAPLHATLVDVIRVGVGGTLGCCSKGHAVQA